MSYIADMEYVGFINPVVLDGYQIEGVSSETDNVRFITSNDVGVRIVMEEGATTIVPWSNIMYARESND